MDVIWLASYPKSGNTWVSFLITAYTQGGTDNLREDILSDQDSKNAMDIWKESSRSVIKLAKCLAMIDNDITSDDIQTIIIKKFSDNVPCRYSLRRPVVKTHYLHSQGHPLINKTFSAILIIRNPRNVLLSTINHMRLVGRYKNCSDTEIARQFIAYGGDPIWLKNGFGSWEEYTTSWSLVKDFPVCVVRYEDLLQAPEIELEKIISFMGLPVDIERIRDTVRQRSLENMKKLESDFREDDEFQKWETNRCFINDANTAQSLSSINPEIDFEFNEKFKDVLKRYDYY